MTVQWAVLKQCCQPVKSVRVKAAVEVFESVDGEQLLSIAAHLREQTAAPQHRGEAAQ